MQPLLPLMEQLKVLPGHGANSAAAEKRFVVGELGRRHTGRMHWTGYGCDKVKQLLMCCMKR